MKRFLSWLLSRAVLGTIGMLALSAVIWWVGPLVAIGSAKPLAGLWTRIIVLAVLWLAWIGRLAWVAWQRKKAHAALLKGIAAGPSAADREAQVLAQRFDEAVTKLKAATAKRGLGSNPLYELPWYVFIGAPGSGKTTALLNAGLNFVLGDSGAAVKGVGGTRNCDWWFTRDAVLVDTAGRYTLQESDREVDAAAWDRFLQLLRTTRPRRPINGVLLTVNVQDLLQQGAPERQEHASKLRARLHELQAKLGVKAPVYVLVTKADLVAGFNETFDALGKEERDQVWGFSFPVDAPVDQPLASFDTEMRALQERLAAGQVDRLQAERDPSKRAAIFGFPQEFAALQPLLRDFLGKVFDSGGALQEGVRLRGVYFTSGTQEGTPIDRAMGALVRSFGLERRAPAMAQQRGKSFFLRRLLQDLVFPEAHLVSFNAAAERRRKLLRIAGFSAVGLAAVLMVVGWAISYTRNVNYAQEVASRLPAVKQTVDAVPPASNGDPTPVLPALAAVQGAARPADFDIEHPPLLNTLGLYQGDKLDAGAQIAYGHLLEHAMMPRVSRRLEERLRAASKDNLEQAYEALKAYVMVYTPDKFDPKALKAWIGVDWDVQFKNLPTEQRAALDAHLDALLADGAPQPSAPMDTALVGSVRDMLASYPLEYRVYSRLKRQFRGDLPDFSVAAAGGPNAPKVFERVSGEPLSRGVPGFYTRDGYKQAFQGSIGKAAAQLGAEEPWVLGRGSATNAAAAVLGNEVSDRVRRLYLQDYIKAWDIFIADVKLVPLTSVERSLEVARLLAAPDSPLASYMRAVARETTLVPAPSQPTALDQAAQGAKKAQSDLAKLAGAQAAPTDGTGPIERMVDDHFAEIRRQVTGQPAPIDDTGKLFADVYAQLQAVDAAQKSKSAPPPAGGGAAVKAAAGQQPEPIRSMLETLADAGAQQGRNAQRASLTTEIKPIYDFCQRAIANRYPFASGSRADVLPEDFGQLFGQGGLIDDFYQRRLAELVDTGGAAWAYKPLADGTRPATPAALADFQRAARIKEAFFRSGGKAPGFKVDIKPVAFDDGLKDLALDIDGQVTHFGPANMNPATVSWPSQRVASQIRLSANGGAPIPFEGPWALFRLFDRFEVKPSAQPEKFTVVMNVDGKKVTLEVTANSVFNPLRLREVQQFRCPGAL